MKRIALDDPMFVPYVCKAMRRGIVNYIFLMSTGLPAATRHFHGIQQYPKTSIHGIPNGNLAENLILEDLSNVIVVDFMSKLPPADAAIVEQRMAGYRAEEIRKMNGLSHRNLRTRGKHIRNAFRSYERDAT